MRQRRLTVAATRATLCLAVAAAWLLALPTIAAAQSSGLGNPLSPGLPQGQSSTTTTATTPALPTTSTTSTTGGGLSGGSAIAIAVGALVILGGISLFIWRDARRRAPARARARADVEAARRSGSKQRAKPRKLSPAERRRRKRGRAR